jgi:hypothetical protein
MELTYLEILSFWRAVIGIVGRFAVRGVGLRITFGGLRIRLSARAFSRSRFWEDDKMKLMYNNIRGCELRKMRFRSHFWQAVIGIMGRIAVCSVRMRITISGIRIRISARAFSQIQGVVHFLTPENKLAKPTPWLGLNSLLILRMSKIHNRRRKQVSSG